MTLNNRANPGLSINGAANDLIIEQTAMKKDIDYLSKDIKRIEESITKLSQSVDKYNDATSQRLDMHRNGIVIIIALLIGIGIAIFNK